VDGDDAGEIYLEKGRIIHALFGDQVGEEAVYALVLWNSAMAFIAGCSHSTNCMTSLSLTS